jgi:hypothetical protein
VAGVDRAAVHGWTLTIAGSGFGAKSVAPPLAWEDFADCALSSPLENHDIDTFANRDNLRTPFSPCNARANYAIVGPTWSKGSLTYNDHAAPRWFVQYWVKLAPDWHWGTTSYGGGDRALANIKFLRFYPIGRRDNPNLGYVLHRMDGSSNNIQSFTQTAGAGPPEEPIGTISSVFTLDTWHCVQFEYGEGSGNDRPDGHARLWIDGRQYDYRTDLVTNFAADGPPVDKRPFVIVADVRVLHRLLRRRELGARRDRRPHRLCRVHPQGSAAGYLLE